MDSQIICFPRKLTASSNGKKSFASEHKGKVDISVLPYLFHSHKASIPQTSRARTPQTLHKSPQLATTQPIATALLERLHAVIDNDPHKLLRPLSTALQLLKVRPGSKRRGPSGTVTAGVLGLDESIVRQGRGGVVQAHCGEDGGHVVVVTEVGVQFVA
jgi:hypothetical protein